MHVVPQSNDPNEEAFFPNNIISPKSNRISLLTWKDQLWRLEVAAGLERQI